jgi:hypothetical protein
VAGRFQAARVGALVMAVGLAAACHPATAQGDACAAPPAWRQPGATPGHPDAELAACLRDKAYQARGVRVPLQSKVAGLIAQCEVEVDQFEGSMVFGSAAGSEDQRAAEEQRVEQQAGAAIDAYQGCGGT